MNEVISLGQVLAKAPAPWSMRPVDAQHVELRDAKGLLICRTNAAQALVGVLVEAVNRLKGIGPLAQTASDQAHDARPLGERLVPLLKEHFAQLERELAKVGDGPDWLNIRMAMLAIVAVILQAARELEIEAADAAIEKTIPFR